MGAHHITPYHIIPYHTTSILITVWCRVVWFVVWYCLSLSLSLCTGIHIYRYSQYTNTMVWGGVCGEVRCGVEWCRVVWFVVWYCLSLSLSLSLMYRYIFSIVLALQVRSTRMNTTSLHHDRNRTPLQGCSLYAYWCLEPQPPSDRGRRQAREYVVAIPYHTFL